MRLSEVELEEIRDIIKAARISITQETLYEKGENSLALQLMQIIMCLEAETLYDWEEILELAEKYKWYVYELAKKKIEEGKNKNNH